MHVLILHVVEAPERARAHGDVVGQGVALHDGEGQRVQGQHARVLGRDGNDEGVLHLHIGDEAQPSVVGIGFAHALEQGEFAINDIPDGMTVFVGADGAYRGTIPNVSGNFIKVLGTVEDDVLMFHPDTLAIQLA